MIVYKACNISASAASVSQNLSDTMKERKERERI